MSLERSLWPSVQVSGGSCEITKAAIALLWAKDEGKD